LGVVEVWVETALNLGNRDLKLMQRLVSRQNDVTVTSVRPEEPGAAKLLH
jgi:hypothetical protein